MNTPSLADRAHQLLAEQKQSWALLRDNFAHLGDVQTRSFDFDNCQIRAQFNPTRLASVSAKVDDRSIRQRKCFLCGENRPPQQTSLDCGDGYALLCNPFPILPEHFTIILTDHRPQRIRKSFAKMLELARRLGSRYTTFYNGPQCGASAPDHLHFQAGTRGFTPVDVEFDRIKRPMARLGDTEVYVADNYLRPMIGLESPCATSLQNAFFRLHDAFHLLVPTNVEPMMSVIASFETDRWRVIVFPRAKHRPSFYFAVDHTKMLLSPGTVDLAGVIVMPVEADFNRLTRDHLTQMYQEISVSDELFRKLAIAMHRIKPREAAAVV